jgi:hypothetical protein
MKTTFAALLLLNSIAILLLSTRPARAEEVTYPSTSEITATSLDAETHALLAQVMSSPKREGDKQEEKVRAKTRSALCADRIKPPSESSAAVKAALSVTETNIATEIEFKRGSGGRQTEAESFSVRLEFSRDDLLIRSSLPRYASDAAGLLVPLSERTKRSVWVEGKLGSDLLFIIPPVAECSVQAVAVCPRTYVPRSTLATTTYSPIGARYYVSGKADGLFALGANETGKIQANIRASKGIDLPNPWFKFDSSRTPSATIRFSSIKADSNEKAVLTTGELPLLGAVETSLDFGTETNVLRTVASRSSIEVTRFDLPEGEKITVRSSPLSIERGPCYLVTKFRDQTP